MSKHSAGPGASLSAKQARFVEEYLIDLNATQAAIRAGYSARTATEQASRLLSNVKVATAIQTAQAARSARTGITQDRVLAELAKIGFSDLRKVLTANGGLLSPQDWDDETAGAISSLEVVVRHDGETDEDGKKIPEHVHKIKAWDKLSALEKIGKHLGMFKDGASAGDEAPPLNININVRDAKGDVRVTQPQRSAGDIPQGA